MERRDISLIIIQLWYGKTKLYGGMSIRNSFLVPVICLIYVMSSTGSTKENIGLIELEKFASIDVNKILKSQNESKYLITVSNTGEIQLEDVEVTDTLPSGMKYVNSSYKNSNDPFLSRCLDIAEGDSTKSITWMLGRLATNQSKEIEVLLSSKSSDATNSIGEVYAEGQVLGNIINKSTIYDMGISVSVDVFEVSNSTTASFDKNSLPESAKIEIYKITVDNFSNLPKESLNLFAKLAKGMKFENTFYLDENRSMPDVEVNPKKFDEETETNLFWKLGPLAPHEIRSVIMELYLKPEVNNKAVTVFAAGKTNGIDVTYKQSNVTRITGCGWFIEDEDGYFSPCQEETAEFTPGCKEICPEWIKSFSPQ